MLNIGNKKYRNLQEQVGYNTEQIEKIFNTLDGLNVTDNVVVISDISVPLDQDELEIVNKEVAFLVYNGSLYIKKSQDSSSALFDIVFTISSAGGVVSFNTSEITVTLSNGALGIVSNTTSTYSTSQIGTLLSTKSDITYVDSQVALCAKLAGADFTGPITSPSIVENMSGYSFNLGSKANFSLEPIYAGAVKTGNKITFVIAVNVTRQTGETTGVCPLGDFVIPSEVGNKLHPTTVGYSSVLETRGLIASTQIYNSVNVSGFINKISATKIQLGISNLSSMSFDTQYYVRYEATFLLSDNLAE